MQEAWRSYPPMMRAPLRLTLAIVAAALCAPAVASADTTFCVHTGTGGCGALTSDVGSDLQMALDQAAILAGNNTILIGAGTYTPTGGPTEFTYTGTSHGL